MENTTNVKMMKEMNLEEILNENPPSQPAYTLGDFAEEFRGETLSILFKNGVKVGHIVMEGHTIHHTNQTIQFDLGDTDISGSSKLLNFNLNDYRTHD